MSTFNIQKNILFLFFINIFIITIITLFISSLFAFISLIFFIIFSFLFIINRYSTIQNHLSKIIFISLPFYLLFAFNNYIGYISTKDFLLYVDQSYFYQASEFLGNQQTIHIIYRECFVNNLYGEYGFTNFIFGIISFIGKNFFDGSNAFVLSIYIFFPAIFISLFTYLTLIKYIDGKKAYKYTLLFSLFSPVFYYSPWLLRDIYITLIYTIGFYLLHEKFSWRLVLKYLILIFFAIQFRFESGVFFIIYPVYYFISLSRRKPLFLISMSVILILTIISSNIVNIVIDNYKQIVTSMKVYSEFTKDQLTQGFGSKLYSLPLGIKELSIVIFSQMSPFPSWILLTDIGSNFEILPGVILMITSIFWSLIFISLIQLLISKKKLKLMTTNILIMLVIAFLFLLVNSSNISVRRLLGVYPIILLAVLYVFDNIDSKKVKGLIRNSMFVYLLLNFVYILLLKILKQ